MEVKVKRKAHTRPAKADAEPISCLDSVLGLLELEGLARGSHSHALAPFDPRVTSVPREVGALPTGGLEVHEGRHKSNRLALGKDSRVRKAS